MQKLEVGFGKEKKIEVTNFLEKLLELLVMEIMAALSPKYYKGLAALY